MTNKSDLLPCPFCGDLPVITKHFREEMYSFMHRCPVVGPISRDFRERAQDHADMWNTRVAPAEEVRAVVDEPVAYVMPAQIEAMKSVGWMHAFRDKGRTGTEIALYLKTPITLVKPASTGSRS